MSSLLSLKGGAGVTSAPPTPVPGAQSPRGLSVSSRPVNIVAPAPMTQMEMLARLKVEPPKLKLTAVGVYPGAFKCIVLVSKLCNTSYTTLVITPREQCCREQACLVATIYAPPLLLFFMYHDRCPSICSHLGCCRCACCPAVRLTAYVVADAVASTSVAAPFWGECSVHCASFCRARALVCGH